MSTLKCRRAIIETVDLYPTIASMTTPVINPGISVIPTNVSAYGGVLDVIGIPRTTPLGDTMAVLQTAHRAARMQSLAATPTTTPADSTTTEPLSALSTFTQKPGLQILVGSTRNAQQKFAAAAAAATTSANGGGVSSVYSFIKPEVEVFEVTEDGMTIFNHDATTGSKAPLLQVSTTNGITVGGTSAFTVPGVFTADPVLLKNTIAAPTSFSAPASFSAAVALTGQAAGFSAPHFAVQPNTGVFCGAPLLCTQAVEIAPLNTTTYTNSLSVTTAWPLSGSQSAFATDAGEVGRTIFRVRAPTGATGKPLFEMAANRTVIDTPLEITATVPSTSSGTAQSSTIAIPTATSLKINPNSASLDANTVDVSTARTRILLRTPAPLAVINSATPALTGNSVSALEVYVPSSSVIPSDKTDDGTLAVRIGKAAGVQLNLPVFAGSDLSVTGHTQLNTVEFQGAVQFGNDLSVGGTLYAGGLVTTSKTLTLAKVTSPSFASASGAGFLIPVGVDGESTTLQSLLWRSSMRQVIPGGWGGMSSMDHGFEFSDDVKLPAGGAVHIGDYVALRPDAIYLNDGALTPDVPQQWRIRALPRSDLTDNRPALVFEFLDTSTSDWTEIHRISNLT